MKIKISKGAIHIAAALTMICSATFAQTKSSLKDEIVKAEAKFVKVFAETGGLGLKDLYASEAIIYPPGSGSISGSEAVGKYWKGGFDAGVKSLSLQTDEVEQAGSSAIEYGRYSLLDASGKQIDNGKYMVIWKKEKGDWKLSRDIWNSSAAAK